MLSKEKVINYIKEEFEVKEIKSIKENKKTINVKFISKAGLDYAVTLNKNKFEEVEQC